MHVYLCADCRRKFETEGYANRCPACRCKVLIHIEGEPRRARKCGGGGSCGGCGGGCSCGGCRH